MRVSELRQAVTTGDSRAVERWTVGSLTEIGRGRRPVTAVRHPLGFHCLPLERGGPEGVCVHLWSADRAADPAPSTSALHSHSWDLLSHVLFGAVGNELLRLVDEPDPGRASHRLFRVRVGPDGDEVTATGRTVRVVPGELRSTSAGRAYALPAGRFHRSVVPPGTSAATVVLGRPRPGAVDLSLGPLGLGSARVVRRDCDRQETLRTAGEVLAGLARRASPTVGSDRDATARA